MSGKTFDAAEERGRQAARNGLRRVCPYKDHRTYRGGVTFSRGLRRAWFRGYDEIKPPERESDSNG